MKSVNPYTGKVIAQYHPMGWDEIFLALEENHKAWLSWKNTSFPNRSALLHKVAEELRKQKKQLSELITNEMGKLIVLWHLPSWQAIHACYSMHRMLLTCFS
jgi:succinate-semialdehyde dehydrogenase / glutarate-semialdehyde dehydrogenase